MRASNLLPWITRVPFILAALYRLSLHKASTREISSHWSNHAPSKSLPAAASTFPFCEDIFQAVTGTKGVSLNKTSRSSTLLGDSSTGSHLQFINIRQRPSSKSLRQYPEALGRFGSIRTIKCTCLRRLDSLRDDNIIGLRNPENGHHYRAVFSRSRQHRLDVPDEKNGIAYFATAT
ncbi:hypothetical protein B0H19DRAFT_192546 [Mycena capillaripes]|nr:hypothetical protein B0H19DRAFT_192546 [Mycena capillaripes]